MSILDMGRLSIINYVQPQPRLVIVHKAVKFDEAKIKRDNRGRFSNKGGNVGGEGNQGSKRDNQRTEGRGQDAGADRGNHPKLRALASKTYEAANDSQYTYHNIAGKGASKAFHSAISAAKEGNPHGAFVHAYEPDEYEEQKLFVSDGGEAGMSVKPNGDIVSVFSNPKIATKRGVAGNMLDIALQNGGNKLDCFDGYLPKLYSKYGFVPVARMKFAREYAPEGWNFERDGEPDVVFFAHNGDDIQTVRNTTYDAPDMSSVPYIDDYDDGPKLQEEYEQNRGGSLTKSLSEARNLMQWWG